MHELEALVTIFMALTNYTEVLCLNLKVSKTSAILEKAIPVILFQTKQKIQTTITKLPICRESNACLFVAAAVRVPELS